MTDYIVDASAQYYSSPDFAADFIEVILYLLDTNNDTYVTRLVTSGTCELKFNETTIGETIEFDARFGNSDGSFKLYFQHPSRTHYMSVSIKLTIRDESDGSEKEYTLIKDVSPLDEDDYGLKQQPPQGVISQ